MRWRSWWGAVAVGEVLILLFAWGATGRTRHARLTGGEGNRIARLLLDEPTFVESMLLYVALFHLLVGAIFLAAWLETRRRRRAAAGRPRG